MNIIPGILIMLVLVVTAILGFPIYRRKRRVSELRRQVRSAWNKLPPDVKGKLQPKIKDAHDHTVRVRNIARTKKIRRAGHEPNVHRHLSMAHSLLTDDSDGLLRDVTSIFCSLRFPILAPDGQLYFSGKDYDLTDPGWAYSLVALAETLGQLPPFNKQPAVIQIPDDASIAIVGDWGGNNHAARQVGAAMKAKKPAYWIHIGDVYYAGTMPPEEAYQASNFLDVWPGTAGKSFTMNSNHDMLAQGTGYFQQALVSPMFSAQKGCSYFALFNKSFRIVALDSAYFGSLDDLYDAGNIGDDGNPAQLRFLADQSRQALSEGQSLILVTHHNGLSIDGSQELGLWKQVVEQLAATQQKSVLWYWGHEHCGNVFNPRTTSGVTIYPRCCGHGCLPWGVASDLENSNIAWFEYNVVGPGEDYFVPNGFAMLELKGASLTETFFDQEGNSHWSSQWPLAVQAAKA